MCTVTDSVSDLCRQIADREFALETGLTRLRPAEAEAALAALRQRRDYWAERVLLEYLGQERFRHLLPVEEKAPLWLDEMAKAGRGEGE